MICSLISYTFQQFGHIQVSLLPVKLFFPLASVKLFLWVDHAKSLTQPSKAALLTQICSQQPTLMERKGSCALVEVRPRNLTDLRKPVEHSGSGQSKCRPGLFR